MCVSYFLIKRTFQLAGVCGAGGGSARADWSSVSCRTKPGLTEQASGWAVIGRPGMGSMGRRGVVGMALACRVGAGRGLVWAGRGLAGR